MVNSTMNSLSPPCPPVSAEEPWPRENRAALRRRILGLREQLPPEERSGKSAAIAARFLALPFLAPGCSIFCYVHFRSEVETLPLIRLCLARGFRVSVPRVVEQSRSLLACAISDPDCDLVPGYQAIPEPRADLPLVDPASIRVAVVPGSVFDPSGGRLGYGGGYYDRFFARRATGALRVGLAYDLQVVAAVPLESHDQKMDCLLTETRTICGQGVAP